MIVWNKRRAAPAALLSFLALGIPFLAGCAALGGGGDGAWVAGGPIPFVVRIVVDKNAGDPAIGEVADALVSALQESDALTEVYRDPPEQSVPAPRADVAIHLRRPAPLEIVDEELTAVGAFLDTLAWIMLGPVSLFVSDRRYDLSSGLEISIETPVREPLRLFKGGDKNPDPSIELSFVDRTDFGERWWGYLACVCAPPFVVSLVLGDDGEVVKADLEQEAIAHLAEKLVEDLRADYEGRRAAYDRIAGTEGSPPSPRLFIACRGFRIEQGVNTVVFELKLPQGDHLAVLAVSLNGTPLATPKTLDERRQLSEEWMARGEAVLPLIDTGGNAVPCGDDNLVRVVTGDYAEREVSFTFRVSGARRLSPPAPLPGSGEALSARAAEPRESSGEAPPDER